MEFNKSKEQLINIFLEQNTIERIKNNELHSLQITLFEIGSTKISISFPGYKARIKGTNAIYDYRVDITKNNKTTPLSHANIIIDIYNKIVNGNFNINKMSEILLKTFKEGPVTSDDVNVKYDSIAPSNDLIKYAIDAHGIKSHNILGNSFDLTPTELFVSIKWIVLQEDINYPISKGYEGRKMPLARYMETLHVIKTGSEKHTLKEVIDRALAHYRPKQWNDMNYSFLKEIY